MKKNYVTSEDKIKQIFTSFQQSLDEEQATRENIRSVCRDILKTTRQLATTLQNIHKSEDAIAPACLKARDLFEEARMGYENLKKVVPPAEFYRYHDHWRAMTQHMCFYISLVVWLEQGILATQPTIAEVLGVSPLEEKVGFHLDIEDYLQGLLLLCSELSRFSVNCVTRADYETPVKISKFVLGLSAGFRLLNLKNDFLRRRFDGLKYEVKKIEEVVYDLSIRGLLPKSEGGGEEDEEDFEDELGTDGEAGKRIGDKDEDRDKDEHKDEDKDKDEHKDEDKGEIKTKDEGEDKKGDEGEDKSDVKNEGKH